MAAWVSILTMYQTNPELFNGLTLPVYRDLEHKDILLDNIDVLSKDDLIDTILMDYAELGVIYADPEILQKMITVWSSVNYRNWLRLWETTLLKYNPIWNRDGVELFSRTVETEGGTEDSRTGSLTGSNSGELTRNYQDNTLLETETSGTKTVNTDTTETGETGGTETETGSIDDETSRTVTDTGTVTTTGTGSRTGTTSETIAEDITDTHNVTGFDSDTLRANTQDIRDRDQTTSGTSSENTTDNSTVTNNLTTSETGTAGRDTSRSLTTTGTSETTGSIDTAESSSGTGTETGTNTGTFTDESSGTHAENTTEGGSSTNHQETTESETRQITGNIGVTTTQAMILEQRKIVEFNIYHYIAEQFKERFLIAVW